MMGDDWIGGFRRPEECSMEGVSEHGFTLRVTEYLITDSDE